MRSACPDGAIAKSGMFESSHPDEAVMVHTESRRPFILSLFQFGDFDGLVGAGTRLRLLKFARCSKFRRAFLFLFIDSSSRAASGQAPCVLNRKCQVNLRLKPKNLLSNSRVLDDVLCLYYSIGTDKQMVLWTYK